jgi:hypothetical protein
MRFHHLDPRVDADRPIRVATHEGPTIRLPRSPRRVGNLDSVHIPLDRRAEVRRVLAEVRECFPSRADRCSVPPRPRLFGLSKPFAGACRRVS